MSTEIEFNKVFIRNSRSQWHDISRVVLCWQPETKQGIYLHVGANGINGFAISREYQSRLPEPIRSQYVSEQYVNVVLHIFRQDIEEFCRKNVDCDDFQKIFVVNQDIFFSDIAKSHWQKAYDNFMN